MSVQAKKHHSIAELSQEDDLIKNQLFKGKGSDGDFQLFKSVCRHTGLNPIMKQIYPIFRKSDGRDVMTIQTSIEGYRLLADRTGKYCPGKEPTFTYNPEGKLISATAYVKKMTTDGVWHEIAATAFFDEFAQSFNGKLTNFWEKMEHNQLAKCAETLAIKKAFPAETSMIRTNEEMNNKISQMSGHPNIQINEETGEIEEIDIAPAEPVYMTKEHIAEIEKVLGKENEYYDAIFDFYKVAGLSQILDDRYEVILRNSRAWVRKQEKEKEKKPPVLGKGPSVFEKGLDELKAEDLPI